MTEGGDLENVSEHPRGWAETFSLVPDISPVILTVEYEKVAVAQMPTWKLALTEAF